MGVPGRGRHLPEAELPPALAVLNPNRRDCAYPDKNLCGAVVALKLAAALMQVLEWEPARRARMGAAGRERVLERYAVERLVEDVDRLYRSLLDARAR